MNSPKNRTPFRLPLRVYLSYLLVLTLIFTAVSFAKFATSGGGSDGARVASFAVDALPDSTASEPEMTFDDASTKFNTSQTHSYVITTRNYNDTGVSEVALSYDIIVTLPGGAHDGLSFTIDGKAPVSAVNGVYTFTGFSSFPASVKTNHENTLTITAASANIPVDISNLLLDISVHFEQID